ncbi:unnamed protein product [Notodromas monacha]|uniref:Uncharacterized protein n=1 Tax=Notodromas monacha TaxID=399045 RepID=A0A7R9BR10_9CRUS|nr:unnamed protein product [Notodromas monacha]CAG0919216.1 unnamed protein product [Notodromas monacha]
MNRTKTGRIGRKRDLSRLDELLSTRAYLKTDSEQRSLRRDVKWSIDYPHPRSKMSRADRDATAAARSAAANSSNTNGNASANTSPPTQLFCSCSLLIELL